MIGSVPPGEGAQGSLMANFLLCTESFVDGPLRPIQSIEVLLPSARWVSHASTSVL